jgi:hypothetical protein
MEIYHGPAPAFAGNLSSLPEFKEEIEQGAFPGPEHSFHIRDDVLQAVTGDPAGKG